MATEIPLEDRKIPDIYMKHKDMHLENGVTSQTKQEVQK